MAMDKRAFIQSLQKELSGDVLSDDYSLGIYSTDASVYQIRPLVIVATKNDKDVIKAIKIAGTFQRFSYLDLPAISSYRT